MRPPAFIEEVRGEPFRGRILWAINTAHVLTFCFLAFAIIIDYFEFVTVEWAIYSLFIIKLLTNTIARAFTKAGRWVLISNGINLFTDLWIMTAAIYMTGGQLSPLYSLYIIEITAVAMLTNLGITVLVSISALLFYGGMAILVRTGVLPTLPPLVSLTHEGLLTWNYVFLDLGMIAFYLGIVTLFSVSILRFLREKEAALEAKTRELEEAGRHKDEFMRNITHELRTPIHGTLGLTALIEDGVYGPVTEKQKEALEGINLSSQNLLQLIDDLLDLARAESGRVGVTPTAFKAEEFVAGVVSTARWMLGRKKLDIMIDAQPELPELVTDRGKLVQILINLLSNAIKFTPEGGRITVRARRLDESAIVISVEDTGIGIPEPELPHVFDEFRQVDGSSSREYGGVGLGLSLVKKFAELLGGQVSVESTPGKGSTFTVRLPLGTL